MTTKATDISTVLSGGSNNIDANASLGGNPSFSPVTTDVLNNLFSDISIEESGEGKEDYRCIYFFNDGDTTVFNLSLWIIEQITDGATIEIGIDDRDEIQRITLSGDAITGGSFTLSYKGVSFVSDYNSDLGIWATALETSLLELVNPATNKTFFQELSITAQSNGPDVVIFDIEFSGKDGKRGFDRLVLEDNSLTPDVEVEITTPREGSPINTIAPEIDVETTPPGGVGFFVASEISPIVFYKFFSDDGFPMWVKRVTPVDAVAKENDGFRLRFSAESLESE